MNDAQKQIDRAMFWVDEFSSASIEETAFTLYQYVLHWRRTVDELTGGRACDMYPPPSPEEIRAQMQEQREDLERMLNPAIENSGESGTVALRVTDSVDGITLGVPAGEERCAEHPEERWQKGRPHSCGGARVWHDGIGATTTDEHWLCLGCGEEGYVDGIDS